MGIEITTNNHRLDVLDSWELTQEERDSLGFDEEFWNEAVDGLTSPQFVKYKGDIIYLETGEGIPDELKKKGWHFYQSDTYFSGHVFKWPKKDDAQYGDLESDYDYEHIIVGTYYVKD